MYHVAEMVRDARRDMQERRGDGDAQGGGLGASLTTWSAFTPFPFLYALCGQITSTMQRKAPDLAKRAAGRTRDCVADAVTHTHERVVTLRLTCTRTGQRLFYRVKFHVEHAPLPGPLAPIQSHVAVPLLQGVEGVARFVTSEELPELYFVAKNSMRRHFFLRHLVLPPLGALESVVRYVVIFPSHVVFPSREEIEDRTDLFLNVSTSRVQTLVENLYSASEVLDQHWSMVQWNILGRGPYESLSAARRHEVIRSVHQRMLIIASHYKLFEFLATIKLQNEMLYNDLLREYPGFGGVPLTTAQMSANAALQAELAQQDKHTFPIWFYKKLDVNSGNGQVQPSGLKSSCSAATTQTPTTAPAGGNSSAVNSSNNSHRSGGWIEFPAHESRRLERKFRWYQQQKEQRQTGTLGPVRPSSVVLVDEGRHEVDLERMRMTPVYWPELEQIVVCRSRWVYAQRNYGLAPYNPEAATVLENAFVYYLGLYPLEKQRLMDLEAQKPRGFFSSRASSSEAARAARAEKECVMNVPVEGHLVEFKGAQDIMQYKRLLAGTTPFTSKRRVYRGDPRVRGDAATLQLWEDAMVCDPATGKPLKVVEDDVDIEEEVDNLVLVVHGIGDALKTLDLINVVTLRSIIDCSTTLRELNREALKSAYFADLGTASAAGDDTDKDEKDEKNEKPTRLPRVEFLPVEWHSKLHMEGLDQIIRDVTLPAIPKLRELANDTVLDVLFFMSPLFHQVILDEVAKEMNRVFMLFQSRHPDWLASAGRRKKKVSIIAHSLGSIICFDILNHQQVYMEKPQGPPCTDDEGSSEEDVGGSESDGYSSDSDAREEVDSSSIHGFDVALSDKMQQRRSRSMSEMSGISSSWKSSTLTSRQSEGGEHDKKSTQQASQTRASPRATTGRRVRRKKLTPRHKKAKRKARATKKHSKSSSSSTAALPSGGAATAALVPKLAFDVEDLFCFGSPVGLFLNVRGQKLDRSFQLPRCRRMFNIYHPYDPVAYRIEPILNPARAHSKAAIIRTFEGKLRFQYQLRNSFRAMWASLRQWRRDFERQVLAGAHSVGLVESAASLTPLSDALEAVTQPYQQRRQEEASQQVQEESISPELHEDPREDDEDSENVAVFGRLCQGLPIDYSLQENEIEIANEYLFALTAHVIYWGNRDASLFVAQKLILEPAKEDWPVSAEESSKDLLLKQQGRQIASGSDIDGEQTTSIDAVDAVSSEKQREREEATASSEVSSGSEDGLDAMVTSLRHRRRVATTAL